MPCPNPKLIRAALTEKCNANQKIVWGQVGLNFWALAVQHCTDAASEPDCVVMMVEPGIPIKEDIGGGKCRYEFSAMVYCGKKPRSKWEIILDAIRKGTGITFIVAAAVMLIVPVSKTLADDPEAAEQLAKAIDGLRRAIEVGVE